MPRPRKHDDAVYLDAYRRGGSLARAAALIGVSPQTVHGRLTRLGVLNAPGRPWTPEEEATLRREYDEHARRGRVADLARRLDRSIMACRKRMSDLRHSAEREPACPRCAAPRARRLLGSATLGGVDPARADDRTLRVPCYCTECGGEWCELYERAGLIMAPAPGEAP